MPVVTANHPGFDRTPGGGSGADLAADAADVIRRTNKPARSNGGRERLNALSTTKRPDEVPSR